MSVAANRLDQHTKLHVEPLLAADVGGTHARVALVQPRDGGTLDMLTYREFACADYPGLTELLRDFVTHDATLPVRRCAVALAGHVIDDTVINDNLAWRVGPSALRAALAFDDVALLNDFEALGYALDDVRNVDYLLLCGPDSRVDGPTLVVGPGTGLGAAVRLPGAGDARVLSTEAGQMDFAPGTARERAVLAHLASSDGYVSYERILSGPGLRTLYAALRDLRGTPPGLTEPEAITSAARGHSDADAVEAVELFCAILGAFVGNLALAYMATGGVYLAGGVLPEIRQLLQQSRFTERFLNKGGMREFLLRVPVRLIEHGRHGVMGAARWYFDRHMRNPVHRLALDDGTAA